LRVHVTQLINLHNGIHVVLAKNVLRGPLGPLGGSCFVSVAPLCGCFSALALASLVSRL
jgi:hypothetical protein